jgi:hypothetical protein
MLTSSAQLNALAGIVAGSPGSERHALLGATELVRANPGELGLHLLRGMEGRTTEHDRHAAADGGIRRQTGQRVRPDNADHVRIDLQYFADDGADQCLVALP